MSKTIFKIHLQHVLMSKKLGHACLIIGLKVTSEKRIDFCFNRITNFYWAKT